ncbi:class I SAM-dependent methyltransferase [Luteimonas cellulosilyticus]|uniref:class I SAM-dependent methyltransferase n=1 Tax=Luteimonas cellulosilyticus TaxID=2683586 RepID=UPI00135AEBBB|nr:class I SAM-dependent methyltransferase [Luteimonas cellulosilyticus]
MNAVATDIDGYVADAGAAYPMHFHREQMPAWLHASATALGFRAPDLATPYRWCELGSGAGLTALVAAACNPSGRFTAVDADTAQIARARGIAERAGLANLDFIHADLREYATHGGEPFDLVVSHGLWAWVSDEVRNAMLAIVDRRLARGGLLELGYMSHPGASQLQGAQRLLHEAGRLLEGETPARVSGALSLLRDLADGGAGFFAEHPGASRQLDAMEREPAGYIAHELVGAHWQPQHVADVIRAFAGVGCGFLGSATPIENIDALSIPGRLQARLRTLPPGPLAETARDLARNQSLRRDLFQRDAHRLDAAAHLAALDALVFAALPGAPSTLTGDLRFETRIGPVTGARDLFAPALDALAQGPRSFATLRALAPYDAAPGLLNQALQALTWAGFVHPCLSSRRDTPADALARQLAPLADAPALALLPAIGSAALRRAPR